MNRPNISNIENKGYFESKSKNRTTPLAGWSANLSAYTPCVGCLPWDGDDQACADGCKAKKRSWEVLEQEIVHTNRKRINNTCQDLTIIHQQQNVFRDLRKSKKSANIYVGYQEARPLPNEPNESTRTEFEENALFGPKLSRLTIPKRWSKATGLST